MLYIHPGRRTIAISILHGLVNSRRSSKSRAALCPTGWGFAITRCDGNAASDDNAKLYICGTTQHSTNKSQKSKQKQPQSTKSADHTGVFLCNIREQLVDKLVYTFIAGCQLKVMEDILETMNVSRFLFFFFAFDTYSLLLKLNG